MQVSAALSLLMGQTSTLQSPRCGPESGALTSTTLLGFGMKQQSALPLAGSLLAMVLLSADPGLT